MREDAHFRAIFRSGANLHRTVQEELRVAGVTAVDGSERGDDARANLCDDRRLLRRCKGPGPLGVLDLDGDLEIRLAPVLPGRQRWVSYEAEPHAAVLALIGDDRLGEDNLAGQRKLAEEGAPENRNPLQRAWRSGQVVCVYRGDRRAAQPVDNRVEQDQAVGVIGEPQRSGDAEGNLEAERRVDSCAGAIDPFHGDAG